MFKKVAQALIALIIILGGAYQVQAAQVVGRISEIFPQPEIAEEIATQLNVSVDSDVTDTTLATITRLSIASSANAMDFSGLNQLVNLTYLRVAAPLAIQPTDIQSDSLKTLKLVDVLFDYTAEFAGIPNLWTLELRGENITQVLDMQSHPELTLLLVESPKLKIIPDFQHIEKLDRLFLVGKREQVGDFPNETYEVTGAVTDIPNFSKLQNLRYLHIDAFPQLTDLPNFDYLDSLLWFEVRYTGLSQYFHELPGFAETVMMIDVSHNQLKEVPIDIVNYPDLIRLDISANMLIDTPIFPNWNDYYYYYSGNQRVELETELILLGEDHTIYLPIFSKLHQMNFPTIMDIYVNDELFATLSSDYSEEDINIALSKLPVGEYAIRLEYADYMVGINVVELKTGPFASNELSIRELPRKSIYTQTVIITDQAVTEEPPAEDGQSAPTPTPGPDTPVASPGNGEPVDTATPAVPPTNPTESISGGQSPTASSKSVLPETGNNRNDFLKGTSLLLLLGGIVLLIRQRIMRLS